MAGVAPTTAPLPQPLRRAEVIAELEHLLGTDADASIARTLALVLSTMVGGCLAAASANVFNCVLDRDIDVEALVDPDTDI